MSSLVGNAGHSRQADKAVRSNQSVRADQPTQAGHIQQSIGQERSSRAEVRSSDHKVKPDRASPIKPDRASPIKPDRASPIAPTDIDQAGLRFTSAGRGPY